jgi:hypothetical protein
LIEPVRNLYVFDAIGKDVFGAKSIGRLLPREKDLITAKQYS